MAKFGVLAKMTALSLAMLVGTANAAAQPATSTVEKDGPLFTETRQNIALLFALAERRGQIEAAGGDNRAALAFLDAQIARMAAEIAKQRAKLQP